MLHESLFKMTPGGPEILKNDEISRSSGTVYYHVSIAVTSKDKNVPGY